MHGGNIQEEITEADICGLHIFEFVQTVLGRIIASFFPLFYFFNCEDHKSWTDIISLSYLFSAAERTNEIIVGTDQLMEI